MIEARPDTTPEVTLRDRIEVPNSAGVDAGRTLLERITAWLSVHVSDQLCLAIDQAEWFEMLVASDVRDGVLGGLAQALEAHADRLRVVLTLRSEFEPVFRTSALAQFWDDAVYVVPTPAHHDLREIIERPARAVELSFEPSSLVDTLIDEVLQAPGGLPLLSVGLRELYIRCVTRNRDRLLTEDDYLRMGRLSGALAQRATALLQELVAEDAAYSATARRVFLRLVVQRDGEWSRRRAHRDEFLFAEAAENRRASRLLDTFRNAHLVILDKDEWEPAHDWLVRGWPMFSMWRTQFGAKALKLQRELAPAARRWRAERRTSDLWSHDQRLRDAWAAMHTPGSWLNMQERAFVLASMRHRSVRLYAALAIVLLAGITGFAVWDLYYRQHIYYFSDYVRRWGEPEGIGTLTESQARARARTIKLVRRGHLGHVTYVAVVNGGNAVACPSFGDSSSAPELTIGIAALARRAPCQWEFAYESDTDTVSKETARDATGHVLYKLQYRGDAKDHQYAAFLNERDFDATIARGDAELVEFKRSPGGRDIETRYRRRDGELGVNQHGVAAEQMEYDDDGHVTHVRYFDTSGKPVRHKEGIAGYRTTFDPRGNPIEVTLFDEVDRPVLHKDHFAGYQSRFDTQGNEIERLFFDESRRRTKHAVGAAGYQVEFDSHGNPSRVVYLDEGLKPVRIRENVAGHRSVFDPQGHEIERWYLDESGNLTRNAAGVVGHRSTFDQSGRETSRTYLNEAGTPMRSTENIAEYRSIYDTEGNEKQRSFFDEAGLPTLNKNGIAGYFSVFGEYGEERKRMYFDEAGQSTRNKKWVAGYQLEFDKRGHEIRHTLLDEYGAPTRNSDGVAEYQLSYDERGNQTAIAYFDERRRPCGQEGVAVIRMRYNTQDELVERVGYDLDGKIVFTKPADR